MFESVTCSHAKSLDYVLASLTTSVEVTKYDCLSESLMMLSKVPSNIVNLCVC